MKILLLTILLILTITSQGQEVVWDSTFMVNSVEYQVFACVSGTGCFAQLVRSKTDTLTIGGVSGNIELLEFDNDGFVDVKFSYLGNNYHADLFLYDVKSKSYIKVDGFMDVSDSKKLYANPNYYYSYHRAGCADMNWVSYLFYIDNFKVYQIGVIYGKGCDSEESEREIEISKIVTLDKIITIETIPIDSIKSYNNYKWGFIEDYWGNNYKKFKNKNAP